MNWGLIAAASVLPLVAAGAASRFFWRRGQMLHGNVAGLSAIFVACLLFGGAEYVDAVRFSILCEAGTVRCLASGPSVFIRLSIFGWLAMFQAIVLFLISDKVEHRQKELELEPPWRR